MEQEQLESILLSIAEGEYQSQVKPKNNMKEAVKILFKFALLAALLLAIITSVSCASLQSSDFKSKNRTHCMN